jgi:hypothetical protein
LAANSWCKKQIEGLNPKFWYRIVAVLAIGIKNDKGCYLAELSDEPYKSAKGKMFLYSKPCFAARRSEEAS